MLKNILSPDFINAILRASTPILFATLASAIASKSGITNMALEGMLLFSALFGVIFSSLTHSFLGGLLITMVIGGLIGFFLAFFILQLKTDEILAAIALNLIATGGTLEAAVHLVEQLGAKVVKIVCLLELKGLHGRDRLTSCPTEAVVSYEGK